MQHDVLFVDEGDCNDNDGDSDDNEGEDNMENLLFGTEEPTEFDEMLVEGTCEMPDVPDIMRTDSPPVRIGEEVCVMYMYSVQSK